MLATSGRVGARLEWSGTVERLRRFVASRAGDDERADRITQDVIVRSTAAGASDRVDIARGARPWLVHCVCPMVDRLDGRAGWRSPWSTWIAEPRRPRSRPESR